MRLWRREIEERSLRAVNLLPAYLPTDSATIRPSTALGNPDVYACTRVLADAAASCPLVTYRRLSDGNRRRVSNHTADLLRNPAEGSTQANLVSTLIAHLCLWGNAYLGKYRDQDGRVEQLLPIAPDRVQVERRSGRIVFTVSDERGRLSEHTRDDVIHVKALGTDGLVGLSRSGQGSTSAATRAPAPSSGSTPPTKLVAKSSTATPAWRFGQAAQELEQERIVVTSFPQNDTRMVPASDRLYQAVVQQRLTLPDHDELRQHMANTIARHNRRGWRLDKPSLEQPNDAIIAMCMALEAMENQPEPVELLAWL